MSTYNAGNQSASQAASFTNLTTPIHLPPLVSNNGADSPYLPQSHKAQNPSVIGYTDLQPENSSTDFGSQTYYKVISNENEVFKDVELVVKLDALTLTGSATQPRYVDDVLCAAIEKAEFQYGNQLQVLYGDELHYSMLQETDEDELKRRQRLQASGLTVEERAALATASQWVVIKLPFWWTQRTGAAWHHYCLQKTTRIAITWRDKGYLLQQTSATSASDLPTPTAGGRYIVDQWLRFSTATISQATKQTYTSMVKSTGATGWLYPIKDMQRLLNTTMLSSATETTVQLTNLTKYGYNMRFWIRPVVNLTADARNNRRWDAIDLKSCHLDISGKRYFPETDKGYMKYGINAKMFAGNPELPIYNIPFTETPDQFQHGLGGFDFVSASSPQLVITTSALDQNYYLDVYLYEHNYVRIVLSEQGSGAETVQPL